MATVADVLDVLASTAPFDKAAGWDPVGLSVGDPRATADKVAVCHDATDAVIDAAIEAGAGLLVTYHPLLFRPTRRFVAGPDASGRALRLAAAGVALGTVHTAFDVAPGGAADSLAAAVGLTDPVGFGPLWGQDSAKVVSFVPQDSADAVAAAMAAAGAGRIGNYSACSFRSEGVGVYTPSLSASPTVGTPGVANRFTEVKLEMNAPEGLVDAVVAALVAAHPYEEPAYDVYPRRGDAAMLGRAGGIEPTSLAALTASVADHLACVPRVAGQSDRTINTAAVLPGAGGDFITTTTADVVITGDVRHHEARRAMENGMAIIDAGHAATERPGVRALYSAVSQVAETADLTAVDADPWTR
ncbi:MAG: Nif3-like dinuclear metal center hexameric protein [Acidimicrobiia bacterium]|nr:Nif3-like dinuclear metal center hexameric protein [Acidimicrobiia bacterium]